MRKADNLTTILCRCHEIYLGTLTSWNPLGHSKPVTGLLYLYLTGSPSNLATQELSEFGGFNHGQVIRSNGGICHSAYSNSNKDDGLPEPPGAHYVVIYFNKNRKVPTKTN